MYTLIGLNKVCMYVCKMHRAAKNGEATSKTPLATGRPGNWRRSTRHVKGLCSADVAFFHLFNGPLGWKDRNMDARVNTIDDSSTSDKNFVNFGPAIPEFCRRVCTGRAKCLVCLCIAVETGSKVHKVCDAG